MSRYLRHFTVVGDDYQAWDNDYKKWEDEEEIVSREGDGPPQAPAPVTTPPRRFTDTRNMLKKLFSAHRFQVTIVCLVIVDALLVLAELLLDLRIIHPDEKQVAPKIVSVM